MRTYMYVSFYCPYTAYIIIKCYYDEATFHYPTNFRNFPTRKSLMELQQKEQPLWPYKSMVMFLRCHN